MSKFVHWLCAFAVLGGGEVRAEKLRPVPVDASATAAIHAEVASKLKDPASARFAGISAGVSRNGITTVCGLVNARNGFGAYGGDTPFTGFLLETRDGKPSFLMIALGDSDAVRAAVTTTCADAGLWSR